ncbi:hypothetical protein BN1080_02096 [Planococcus massiliensis]|uniref:Uncharacterized protein n=1 Tax=Planococcus massiliensis TaxID=1499687 RepID=A0A098EMY2_9BACL|nr:hypothetical protein [Planococcus massiliensis]CEG23152.1 hypothetical protein BN1080_02096 [Planococcus massiliensis]
MNILLILCFLLVALVCFASGMATGEFITSEEARRKRKENSNG